MLKRIKFLGGLSALLTLLTGFFLVTTVVAHNNASTINDQLNISTYRVETNPDADPNENTVYYGSTYGEFNYENQMELYDDTVLQNINEMREGAVLLYNTNNALPLSSSETSVSVFGHASVDPVYKSASAGNTPTADSYGTVTLDTALEGVGFSINETLWTALENGDAARGEMRETWGGVRLAASGSGQGNEEPIAFYTALESSWSTEYNDVAIVTLARQGAEGQDMIISDVDDDGVTEISSLALHQNEIDMFNYLNTQFSKVIVLLNSPNQTEVEDLKEYVDAILYIGQPGQQGFIGVAEILTGAVNPSGHLADTYAVNSLSAPAVVNSGTNTPEFLNADAINDAIGEGENATYMSFQAEGIYIGYRYYETRYEDLILNQGNANSTVGSSTGNAWDYADEISYSFGYGLSYTTFSQTLDNVKVNSDDAVITVTVENTGSVAGKSVVQVYAQTPFSEYEIENGVEKASVAIVGFAKTDLLQPGETETVTVTVDKYLLASYDTNGIGGYYLSEGDYFFAIGDHAHDALNNILAAKGATGMYDFDGNPVSGDTDKVYEFSMNYDASKYQTSTQGVVENRFEDCDLNYWVENAGVYLSRTDWEGTYPVEQTKVTATSLMIEQLSGELYETASDALRMSDITYGVDAGLLLIDMRDVDYNDVLWNVFIQQMTLDQLAITTVESFTNPENPEIGVPSFLVGDGDDSIGGKLPFQDNGEDVPTMTYCSKTILTSTFNVELMANRGFLMGEEGVWRGTMQNYNIGANLHRTPFGGRAFEYMSECPTMSYLAAIPEVLGMESTGSGSAPKHFAGNDQEFQREGVVVFFNEQAFREGSLKGFEGAINVARSKGLMQSFERLGLVFTSSSYALNTGVLRGEWGWTGSVTTDAIAGQTEGYKSHYVSMQAAGSQQYCLDFSQTSGATLIEYVQENDDGYILSLMQQGAKDWYYALVNSPAINGISSTSTVETVRPWWSSLTISVTSVFSVCTVGSYVVLALGKFKK